MSTKTDAVMNAPYRLGHLNIFVTDVEASAKFYSDVCGFKEVFREPGISMIFMSNGNTHHDLGLMEIMEGQRIGRDGHVQASSGRARFPGLNHLGFELETEKDLVDCYHRAKNRGVTISRTTDHIIAHSLYMTELNGFTFEYYADVTDDWREVYAKNVGQLISGHWDPDAGTPFSERKGVQTPELFRSETAPIQARNVAYAGLPVKSLSESLKYYTGILGMTVSSLNEKDKIAVLSGSEGGGCDVCLVESETFPDVQMLFGGIQMHGGQTIQKSYALLGAQGIQSTIVGEGDEAALVVLDPDGIPLVYSTVAAAQLMAKHDAAIVREVLKLKSVAGRVKPSAA